MPKAKAKKDDGISVEPISFEVVSLRIVGVRPLIVNAWDPKVQSEMISKQMKLPIKSAKQRERNPIAEFEASRYRIPEDYPGPWAGLDGIPAAAFKQAFVDACRHTGLTMVGTQGAFHVRGLEVEQPPITIVDKNGKEMQLGEKSMELIPIYGDEPTMRMDMVRLEGGGSADMRFRPQYKNWWCLVPVQIAKGSLTVQQVLDLANRAGFHCGICEWRPMSKKSKNGSYGMFKIASTEEEQKRFEDLEAPSFIL